MLDEVHLLHDDFVRNQDSDKIKFHEIFRHVSWIMIILLGLDCSSGVWMKYLDIIKWSKMVESDRKWRGGNFEGDHG